MGDVEGDLTIQERETASLAVEAGFSKGGAGVEAKGSLVVTDRGDAIVYEDVSLSEVVELVEEELPELEEILR